MNKRFTYSNLEEFKKSIEIHAQKNSINLNKETIDSIYKKNNNINKIQEVIESKSHEIFIEKRPNEIFNLIQLAKEYSDHEKIIFESMQAYLRSVINTLR